MAKIQFNDKVNIISQPVPEVNKVTAANLNEIKTSVNINVDNIALNATDLSLKADIGGNSSERFKVSTALTSDDAVNKEQLESLDTTLQNNIDLKADIASIVNNVTAGGSSVPLSAEQGKVLKAEITALAGSLIPQGNWDASTNTPDISGTTQTGYYWFVSVEGATDIGGITDWKVSDWVVKTADGFAKIDNTDKVLSVAGKIGEVVLSIADITSLQTSLNLKANKASPSFTGDATFGGDVQLNSDFVAQFTLNSITNIDSVINFKEADVQKAKLGYDSSDSKYKIIVGSGSFAIDTWTLGSTGNTTQLGDASFGGSVTASSFVGAMQENFTSLTANYTLKNSDYNVHNGQQFSVSALTIPTGLSTKRSWEISAEGFDVNITEASGVNITVIANGAPSTTQLTINGAYSARLVATATANEFLLIK